MGTFYLKKPAEPVEYLGKKDSESYPVNYKKKGLCYIFNHENFKDSELGSCEKRIGTDIDAHQLKNVFEKLYFVVEEFKDYTYLQILEKLQLAQKLDKSEYSIFICCILSYGKEGNLCDCEGFYPVENIYRGFFGDKCKGFAGKPKIFFIQACPCDVDVSSTESSDYGKPEPVVFRIPTRSDFLVVYSTIPGYRSWNLNSDQGSWFIDDLCTTIETHISEMDLLQLLSIVNYKLSERHKNKGRPVEVSCVTSTLIRDVKLTDSASGGAEILRNKGFSYDIHNKKGKVLIFNHKSYKKNRCPRRPGTEKDKRKLEDLFKKLNFEEPCCFEQPTKETIFEILKTVADMNHDEYSCFICCILTHGNCGTLSAYDQDYTIDNMLSIFFEKWNGKPKIFLIQACQGEQLDAGCKMVETTTLTESSESDTDSEESDLEEICNFRYLSQPDFLLLSSAPPGYFSFRNPDGSWMVQELYEVFSHHSADKDFLQIFTKTNLQVAERVSYNPDEKCADINDKKITLCLTSTLTRNLDFRIFN